MSNRPRHTTFYTPEESAVFVDAEDPQGEKIVEEYRTAQTAYFEWLKTEEAKDPKYKAHGSWEPFYENWKKDKTPSC